MSNRHRFAGLSRGVARQPPTTFGPQGPQGAQGASGGADELIILAGVVSHDLDGWKVAGAVTFDPADYTFTTSLLEVHISVADAAHAGEARLWNVTTGTQIGAAISSTALVVEVQQLAVALTAGTNTYELQIRNVDDGYMVNCSRGSIRFVP